MNISGYCIGFDVRSQFSLLTGVWGKNAITFGMKNSSSLRHVDNKNRYLSSCCRANIWIR